MKRHMAIWGMALASVAVLATLVASTAFAQVPGPGGGYGGYGPGGMMGRGGMGGGMMGGYGGYGPGPNAPQGSGPSQGPGNGGWGMGGGIMGGLGGMMNGLGRMMGGWFGQRDVSATPLTIDQAEQAARQYMANGNFQGLDIDEIMQFDNNLYIDVKEKDTGVHAFELLVDPYSGAVYPEMGPNMMWNTKYSPMGGGRGGMMGGGMMGRGYGQGQPAGQPTADMPVKPDQAAQLANDYLAGAFPGTTAGEPETFYGYYTLDIMKDGKPTGMLSVNGYGGQVWYHSWHGAFLGMKDFGQ